MIKVGLFAEQKRETKIDKISDALGRLAEHVDFAALAAEIDEAAPRPGRERGGHPPFPTELTVRVLVVQQLYNLSCKRMELQLPNRLSFQRFVGLRQSSQAPDRLAIWTFKEWLIKAEATDRIFEAVSRQLDRHGYIARGGQMVDASIVPVPQQALNKGERAIVQQDAMPSDWSPSKHRQKDVQARWTQKHGQSDFGFKLSSSVDRRHKLIHRAHVSAASEIDTLHFERVRDAGNTNCDIYADKGYVDSAREQRLRAQGWRVHTQRKGQAGQPQRTIRSDEASTLPRSTLAWSMRSPLRSSGGARRCAASAWRGRRCI